jgi:uncharacterized membrane protein YhaH (DUF805 family)
MFEHAVRNCLSRLSDFRGRTSREHFFPFANAVMLPLLLVTLLGIAGFAVFVGDGKRPGPQTEWYLSSLFGPIIGASLLLVVLAIALTAAATVRRLHDAGASGWWYGVPAGMAVAYGLLYVGGQLGVEPARLLLVGLLLPFRLVAMGAWAALIVYLRMPGDPHPNRYGPAPSDDAPDPDPFEAQARRVDARFAALVAARAIATPEEPPKGSRTFGRRGL